MKRRSYQRESDLELLQSFNAKAIAETDCCGYLHPGDIPHHIYNGNRLYDPGEVMTIWEDDEGVAAWVLAQPRHKGYDAQVRPDLRRAEFEREILQYAQERTIALMRRHEIEGDRINDWAFRADTIRVDILAELGWVRDEEPPWSLNRITLADAGEPMIPDGYTIRAARGLDDAAQLADVHVASFGSKWTPDTYRTLMQTPGYAAEREFVVEASDGTFAAFTVTWHDHVNRIGLFEPVGTHSEHRRRGLGRALMLYAMRKMADAGMEYAIVTNEGTNEASRELYRACGFKPWYLLDDYSKPVPD